MDSPSLQGYEGHQDILKCFLQYLYNSKHYWFSSFLMPMDRCQDYTTIMPQPLHQLSEGERTMHWHMEKWDIGQQSNFKIGQSEEGKKMLVKNVIK